MFFYYATTQPFTSRIKIAVLCKNQYKSGYAKKARKRCFLDVRLKNSLPPKGKHTSKQTINTYEPETFDNHRVYAGIVFSGIFTGSE